MKNWLPAILGFVFAISFSQNLWAQNTEYAFKDDLKAFSVNGAAGNRYVWKLTLPNQAVQVLSSTGSSSGQIAFPEVGSYILWVQATNTFGCLTEPLIRTIEIHSEITAKASITNASENAGSDGQFMIDLGAVNNTGSAVQVNFTVSGTATPAADYMALPLSATIPAGTQTVTVDVSGIIDDLLVESNETIILALTGSNHPYFPVSADQTKTSATVFIADNDYPAMPTVNSLSTNIPAPQISGTATVGLNETFSVKVNGIAYKIGDGNLSLSGNTWKLKIPESNALKEGVYEVTANITSPSGLIITDNSTSELTIREVDNISDRLATNDINLTFKNTSVSGQVLVNDAGYFEANSTVTIPTELKSVNGTLSISDSGNYTYTPKTDFVGTDNFYYTVCTTENPADCDTVNVTIQVLNDELSQIAPVAMDDEMQTRPNSTVSGNVLANDLSVSGEKLFLNLQPKDGPKSGKLSLKADGSYTYSPNQDFTGQDYFVYEICGNVSGLCARGRATITVSADQDEMSLFAADDVFFSYGKTTQGNLLANDLYPSAGLLTISKNLTVQPLHGTVTLNNDGTFNYIPEPGFVGTDQFAYQICDSQAKECDNATVYILVKAAPLQYADLSIQKEGTASVIPGGTITYQLSVTNLGTATATQVQISDYLSASVLNARFKTEGSSVWQEWNGFYELNVLEVQKSFGLTITGNVAQSAPDTIKNVATVTSQSWDPSATNNISTINTIVLRGPVAQISGAPYLAIGACNTTGKILDASPSKGDGLTFSWSPITYLDNPTSAKPVYRPGKTTRYKLTVTDINGQKDTASVLVVVPEAPKAVTDKNVFVDKPNTTILLNGVKSTGAGLSFLWTSKEGTILNGQTTPTAQVSGLGIYYLQVTDSLGCTNRDSVNVGLYIQAINDTAETKVNESVIINVVQNDIPQKSVNPSSISIVTLPLHGMASVSADSLILYMPEESYIGQDEFVYAVCDYFKNCDQAKVLVIINDYPFFIPEAFSPNGDGINDKFEIKGLFKYQRVEIEIFNRWGNLVYQSKNYGEGQGKDGFWDGTARQGLRVGSGPVPTGTYFYVLRLNGKENINGSIYLDR